MNRSIHQLLSLGTRTEYSVIENRCITFSNVVYTALPIVYAIFLITGLDNLIKPFGQWVWDQYMVPAFMLFCLFCLFLNHKGNDLISRLIFLVAWPAVFHLVPIIIQHTPADYYLAYPFGVVFHGVLIQALLSRKTRPWLYWSLITANLVAILTFVPLLKFFDTDMEYVNVAYLNTSIYAQVGTLYWLLFNLVTYYLIAVMDDNIARMQADKELIAAQKDELEASVKRLTNAQKQLVQSEKMASIGLLVSGVAHELNNPLNVIAGGLNVIRNSLNDLVRSEKGRSVDHGLMQDIDLMMKTSREGVQKASGLVKSLMMSVGDSSEASVFNVGDIVSNVISLLKLKDKSDIEMMVSDKQVYVQGFPGKIHRAISCVLDNALYWSGMNSDFKQVRIFVESVDNNANISISNNGPAIPKGVVKNIYDPFFTTKDPGDGAGLGLYFAYQIIQEQGGQLSLSNQDGAVTFRIQLPLTQAGFVGATRTVAS